MVSISIFAQDDMICYPKDVKARYREHNTDFIKAIINVHFDTRQAKVLGDVNYVFQAIQPSIDSLYLDGPGIKIEELKLDNTPCKFTTTDEGINIYFDKPLQWNETHELRIKYHCFPRKGIYFIGWDDEKNISRKQIWTQGQGIDNRHWIPGFDDVADKLITETIITFDKDYEVVSNGNLVSTQINKDGSKTWHYALNQPHAFYLVMIGIDKYAYKDEKGKNGIRIRNYYYPECEECYEPTYEYSSEMMNYLEQEFGIPYPWESYANVPVQDFLYGAMENTTSTVYTDLYFQDKHGTLDRSYVGTNAHELVHQWFGDYVTERSGTHHWLHESFATHYAKHFRKSVYGDDYYQWMKRDEANSALRAGQTNSLPVAHSESGSSRHYPKGSFVIDMLRYVVGEEGYHKAIQYFLKKHPYQSVDTHEFYLAFYETLGINLDWFFDEWIYRGGEPDYLITRQQNGSDLQIFVEQKHPIDNLTSYFKMPINFEVYLKSGKVLSKQQIIENHFDTINFNIPVNEEVNFVLFDPDSYILKSVTFEKSADELIAQLLQAKNMIDRYDALTALKNVDSDSKRAALQQAWERETFDEMQAAIINQLASDDNEKSQEIVKSALQSKFFKVRRTVLSSTDIEKHPDWLSLYEDLLNDDSYVTRALALKKLCASHPEKASKYLNLTENMDGMSKNIKIEWLKQNIRNGKLDLREQLVDLGSESYEFRTRIAAFEALVEMNYYDADVIENAFSAMFNPNYRLAGPVAGSLKSLMLNESCKKQVQLYIDKHTFTDWQKEIINKQLGIDVNGK